MERVVDGKPVELLRANYTFRAVPIPAGTHSVELRYEPESLRYGLLISIATAILMAGISGRRCTAGSSGGLAREEGGAPLGIGLDAGPRSDDPRSGSCGRQRAGDRGYRSDRANRAGSSPGLDCWRRRIRGHRTSGFEPFRFLGPGPAR